MTRFSLAALSAVLLLAAARADAPNPPKPAEDKPAARKDLEGEPLPPGVLARMGSTRLRSADRLDRLIFAPNGKTLFVGSLWQGSVRVCERGSGKVLRRINIPSAGPERRRMRGDMAVSKKGELVVLSYATRSKQGPIIRAIDPASGKELRKQELKLPAELVANPVLSVDGETATFVLESGSIRRYELAGGKETLRIDIPQSKEPIELTCSGDGKRLAIVFERTIRVYDATNGMVVKELAHPAGFFFGSIGLSRDGRLLASVAWGESGDGLVILWDLDTGKERYRQTKTAYIATFSPDAKHLAIGAYRKELRVVDTASGKVLHELPSFWTWLAAFSPDGKTLASAFSQAVTFWDVASGRRLPASCNPPADRVRNLRFADDGRRLLGTAENVITWDAHTGKELGRSADKTAPQPESIAASPDESLLASLDRESRNIIVWEAATGKEVRRLENKGWLWPLAFADNRRLVASGADGIEVWDVKAGKLIHQLGKGNATHYWPVVSADGNRLACWPRDRRSVDIQLWDLETGRAARELSFPSGDGLFAGPMAFSRDGRLVAASGRTGPPFEHSYVRIWDAATGQNLLSWEVPKRAFICFAFSPDRRMLASGGEEGDLSLWELATQKERHRLTGHESGVASIAFSPDGRRFAASSADAPVYVWDVFAGLPAPRKLEAADLDRCWTDLAGDDAPAAFRAIRMLSSAPEQALPFLKERLKPKQAPDAKLVARLAADLDSPKFTVRQKAAEDLEKLGDGAVELLQKALAKVSTEESRQRLEKIVGRLQALTSERLREIRAVEALEWMATPEATRLLDALSQGVSGTRLTSEAAEARARATK